MKVLAGKTPATGGKRAAFGVSPVMRGQSLGMSRIAGPMRMILILVLIVANIGHHGALAATDGRDVRAEQSGHVSLAASAHHRAGSVEADDGMGATSERCCVVGQCMVCLAPESTPELPGALRAGSVALVAQSLLDGPGQKPFRPPA